MKSQLADFEKLGGEGRRWRIKRAFGVAVVRGGRREEGERETKA